jgi:hypothetical protein
MKNWRESFDEALGELSFGFEDGDDGDQLTLALDSIASVLSRLPALREYDGSSLVDLVEGAGGARELVENLSELGELGQASGYGDGFDRAQAKRVNQLAAAVREDLELFTEKFLGEKKKRATVRATGRNARTKKS